MPIPVPYEQASASYTQETQVRSFKAVIAIAPVHTVDGEVINPCLTFEKEFEALVPVDGGIRTRMLAPLERADTLRLWLDENGNELVDGNEVAVTCTDVRRIVAPKQGCSILYWTPPPYSPDWPPALLDRTPISLEVTDDVGGRHVFPNSVDYTADPLLGIDAVEEGMQAAFRESFDVAQLIGGTPLVLARLDGEFAGARAETILRGIMSRVEGDVIDPTDDENRIQLSRKLAELPLRIANFMNSIKPREMREAALVRPITMGQVKHAVPEQHPDDYAIATFGTGTLVITSDLGGSQLTRAPHGTILLLPQDFYPIIIGPGDFLEWGFVLEMDEEDGLALQRLNYGFRSVSRNITTPAIDVGGQQLNLRKDALSYIMLFPEMEVQLDGHVHHHEHGGGDPEPTCQMGISAVYRLPLDGTAPQFNEAKDGLSVRQFFAFTDEIEDYEPSHCLVSASVYPQVAFRLSQPGNYVFDGEIHVTQRLALNPGGALGEPDPGDRYLAGLFRDIDYPLFFLESKSGIVAPIDCQPLPMWWNMFDYNQSEAPVETGIVFDTEDGSNFLTPDNIHLHEVHETIVPGWDLPVEAPGSFDGTIHMHWRWGHWSRTGIWGWAAAAPGRAALGDGAR